MANGSGTAVRCVVVAVDGSEQSLRAVDWGADEAARRRVPLRLVHACLWERYERDTEDEDEPLSVRNEVRQLIAAALERAAERQPAVETATEVIPEDAVPALLGLGGLAPLLVLGHRGRGGFEGLLLGSVGLRVVGRAEYPVVLVRGEPSEPTGRLVLAVDENERATAAAAGFAVAEARVRGAELDLVHAWQRESFRSGGSILMTDVTAEELAGRLVAAVPLPDADGLTVHRRARRGRAAKVLLEAAAGADLVVLAAGRHAHGGLQLGSVSHAVLHHAPCPVAVVPVG
ncbi:universal stress protein [Kitasatospora sp. NPDC057015]|uniref:universal stress protein n=1 Tax=Kitasatospora sp. NPDC057015 TaxID=3346001 RepID=UPI0036341814